MQCVGYPAGTGHALKHKQQDEFVKQHERGAASPSFSSPPSILFFWCLSLSHSSHCMACEKWKMKNSFALSSDIINFSLFCTDQANAAEASAAAEKEGTKKTETRSTLIGDTDGEAGGRREKRGESQKMEISNAAASGVSSLVYNCRTVRSKCCIYEGRGKRRQRRVGTEWTQSEQSIRLILSWLSKLHFMRLHSLRWAFKTLQYY